MRIRRLILSALLSLSVTACSQGIIQGSPAASSGPPLPTERPTATPAPTPEFPAPTDLQGAWTSATDGAEDLELEIRETGYRITTSNPLGSHSGSGRVEVNGNEITFSNSTLCAGDGRYRWSIEDDVLRFEPIGTDPCPNRAATIGQVEYTRAE